jgi:RNA polymerase sigma-70 factor (ECF subfamily)
VNGALPTLAALGPRPPAPPLAPAEDDRVHRAVRQHYAGLWRFLRRMGLPPHQADDVAQTTILVALEALSRIVMGSERAFLYATAVRLVYGIRRRSQREVASADVDQGTSPCPLPDDLLQQKRVRDLVDALLERIERKSRAVFVHFELDGFTIPEISTALDISPEAASSRLRKARKQLRALARNFHELA